MNPDDGTSSVPAGLRLGLRDAAEMPDAARTAVETGTADTAECPVGARLASRRRAQIIRSVAAPERRECAPLDSDLQGESSVVVVR